jgi:hypothetical protein
MSFLTVKRLNSGCRFHLYGAGGLGRELASELLKNCVSPEQLMFAKDDGYHQEGYLWCGIEMCRFELGLEYLLVALGNKRLFNEIGMLSMNDAFNRWSTKRTRNPQLY